MPQYWNFSSGTLFLGPLGSIEKGPLLGLSPHSWYGPPSHKVEWGGRSCPILSNEMARQKQMPSHALGCSRLADLLGWMLGTSDGQHETDEWQSPSKWNLQISQRQDFIRWCWRTAWNSRSCYTRIWQTATKTKSTWLRLQVALLWENHVNTIKRVL